MRRLALVAPALLLAACTLGPDYKRPAVDAPPDFRSAMAPSTEPSLSDLGWWQLYPDETLQGLIREALASNYDVRVAAARILDARAQVTITRSFQFPEVRGIASAPYERVKGELAPFQVRETFTPSGGLDFGFELDFWGRFRRGTEAARAEFLATEYGRRLVITTLISDLSSAYFSLRALDEELEIARRTLGLRTQSLGLVRRREEGGVAGLIDVRQSEILVAGLPRPSRTSSGRSSRPRTSSASCWAGRPPPYRAAATSGRKLGSPRCRRACRPACSSAARTSSKPSRCSRRRPPASGSRRATTFRGCSCPARCRRAGS